MMPWVRNHSNNDLKNNELQMVNVFTITFTYETQIH